MTWPDPQLEAIIKEHLISTKIRPQMTSLVGAVLEDADQEANGQQLLENHIGTLSAIIQDDVISQLSAGTFLIQMSYHHPSRIH